ncbi:hypothetical protein [Paenibacillus sp. XY044]|uniref:hypothetical protein n=1 Tax=Paenibacillus sp. XY044 TaxID=2026089 RepID=UPI000B998941|nr:hypothetical protein [Paenibacillus sp. XY044]OZB98145.1 hypothetical protein CJP46_02955 [Paenibacillus sp. XY044]
MKGGVKLSRKLKKKSAFRVQDLWEIEKMALYAIARTEKYIEAEPNPRLRSMAKGSIEHYKEIIMKCYWQQGKKAADSWNKYLPDLNSQDRERNDEK